MKVGRWLQKLFSLSRHSRQKNLFFLLRFVVVFWPALVTGGTTPAEGAVSPQLCVGFTPNRTSRALRELENHCIFFLFFENWLT